MNRNYTGCLIVMLLGFSIALSPVAYAAKPKKDSAAKRIAQMQQQMEAEKAQMQSQFDQDKAALEAKVKSSEDVTEKVKGSLAAANRKAKELNANLEALRKEKADLDALQLKTQASLQQTQTTLDTTRKTLEETNQKLQTAQREIKDGDAQRKELTGNLSKKGQQVMACEEKNAKLHDFGLQLVKIYDKPSTYEAVMRTEPFVQTKRVELENILQDYRDKLDDQKFTAVSK